MYKRKTKDVWEVQSNWGYGWDVEVTEETRREAIEMAQCYRENCNAPIRIVKRVKKENN